MLKLFCLVFTLGTLLFVTDLVKSKSVVTRENDNSLVRVKRIIGGRIADRHRNSVFTILDQEGYCTGTFIAPNLILTAAHCCENLCALSSITIYNEKRAIKATVSKVYIEPGYAAKYVAEDDIAVIRLDSNVDSISVAPLGFDYAISCDETVYQYGFGHTDSFNQKMSEQLKVCTGKVVECSWFTYYKYYIPFVYHNDAVVIKCQDGITSSGDSGGPVFNQAGSIIAVHSVGSNQLRLSGCSRIWKHKKFLREILSQN